MVVAVVVVVGLCLAHVITASRLADDRDLAQPGGAAIAYFAVILSSRDLSATERSRVLAFIPMFMCSAVFWSLYQQQFTVVTIYSDKRLDRNLFGWEMPVSWVQSINPVFIIVLAGVFAALWTRLGDRQPRTPVKFGLATILMGVAFWMFLLMPSGENSVPLLGLGRDPAGLHGRRAADLTGRPVVVDQAGARDCSTPRWWRCSSSRSASVRRCRASSRSTTTRRRDAVLPLDRAGRGRDRRGDAGPDPADQPDDEGRALTGANARASGRMPSTSTIGTAKPIRRLPAPARPIITAPSSEPA